MARFYRMGGLDECFAQSCVICMQIVYFLNVQVKLYSGKWNLVDVVKITIQHHI